MEKQIQRRLRNKQGKKYRVGKYRSTKHFFLIPLAHCFNLYDIILERYFASLKWSNEKAQKIANKYFGKICDIDNEGTILWYCMTWQNYIWLRVARGKWIKKFYRDMPDFIMNHYQIEGYEKTIEAGNYDGDDMWIKFTLKGKE